MPESIAEWYRGNFENFPLFMMPSKNFTEKYQHHHFKLSPYLFGHMEGLLGLLMQNGQYCLTL